MTDHPISRLAASSFGAFASIDVEFAPGINVIVGENGAGKSQLIKLLYATTSVLKTRDALSPDGPRRTALTSSVAAKLVGTFRPEALGRLTNRRRGRTKAAVMVDYAALGDPLEFSFASNSSNNVQVSRAPRMWIEDDPVYLPTRELLSIYPGFVSLYNERALELDETWRDTADLLGRPALRGPRFEAASRIMAPLEEALGGSVVEQSGRFYLMQSRVGKLEMHLVAEGLRKLGMLARLVSSGTLLSSGYLFWDEPEANLNPRVLRQVAETIVELRNAGVQIFVATHSLFILREIEILLSNEANNPEAPETRFIGLHRTDEGVVVEQGPSLSDIGDITALDEELNQSDRYLRTVE